MLRTMKFAPGCLLAALTLTAGAAFAATPDQPGPTRSLADRTASMRHMPGLISLDWDAKAGKLYFEVPMNGNADHTRSADLLYTTSTPWSVGTSQLGGYGLDRGQIGQGVIVHFERTGPKLLLVEPNLRFRSSSSDPAEQA